jgi:hypothetical protein
MGKQLKVDPLVIDREVRALDLRRAGLSYQQIAKEVGWAAESSAFRAVKRALDRTLREPAEAVRNFESDRLDEWLLKLMPAIDRGEPRSIEVALKISERRSKLLGLDAPSRQELSVDVLDGSLIEAEVLRLASMLDGGSDSDESVVVEGESWE